MSYRHGCYLTCLNLIDNVNSQYNSCYEYNVFNDNALYQQALDLDSQTNIKGNPNTLLKNGDNGGVSMKIEYEKVGEYYLPNLTVKGKKIILSKYGRMKLRYMKKYQKILYTNLLTNGGLYEYLESIDHQASALYDKLLVNMKRNISEGLKEENQMLWIQEMNNIDVCINEIIYEEYIYN